SAACDGSVPMKFLRPEFLNLAWALLILIAWSMFALRSLHRARQRLSGVTSRPTSLFRRALQMAVALIGLACLILALARPQIIEERRTAQLRRMDAVILLDTSPSMRAQDIQPSRLARATEVIASFIQRKLPDDRFGLVSFADNSLVLSYLTGDANNILFYLDYLREQGVLEYGTNIGGALRNAMVVLSRQAEIEPAARKNKKVVILLSDGEDHGEELQTEVNELIRRGVPVYCVGIGSREGAFIPIGQVNGRVQYLTGKNDQPLLTVFDESTLRNIAARSGGRYYRARTGQEMNQAFDDIFAKAREIQGYTRAREPRELYRELLAAAFALFLLRILI
ncbi:MAG TPA: VWA domain-containing protein, partial [Bryobacteraceae bacterium]|nr:VWA domain-containing protein [Bryobacteraceae bacterium]